MNQKQLLVGCFSGPCADEYPAGTAVTTYQAFIMAIWRRRLYGQEDKTVDSALRHCGLNVRFGSGSSPLVEKRMKVLCRLGSTVVVVFSSEGNPDF